jgi:hypothetical protein
MHAPLTPEPRAMVTSRISLGRFGLAEEIANSGSARHQTSPDGSRRRTRRTRRVAHPRGVVAFFVLALMLSVAVGFLAAIAYAARARHPAQGRLRRGLKLIQNTADRGGIGGQERSIS